MKAYKVFKECRVEGDTEDIGYFIKLDTAKQAASTWAGQSLKWPKKLDSNGGVIAKTKSDYYNIEPIIIKED